MFHLWQCGCTLGFTFCTHPESFWEWLRIREKIFFTLPSSSPCLVLSEGWPSTLLFLTLSSFLLSTVIAIGPISTCPCKGGSLMFLGRPLASLLLVVLLLQPWTWQGQHQYMWIGFDRLISFRKAFGLILFSSSPCLLFLTAVYVIGLEIIYMSLQGW